MSELRKEDIKELIDREVIEARKKQMNHILVYSLQSMFKNLPIALKIHGLNLGVMEQRNPTETMLTDKELVFGYDGYIAGLKQVRDIILEYKGKSFEELLGNVPDKRKGERSEPELMPEDIDKCEWIK